jgi:hypothetical protein
LSFALDDHASLAVPALGPISQRREQPLLLAGLLVQLHRFGQQLVGLTDRQQPRITAEPGRRDLLVCSALIYGRLDAHSSAYVWSNASCAAPPSRAAIRW